MEHTAACNTPSFVIGQPLPTGQGLASLMLAIGPEVDASAFMPEGCNIQLFPDGEFAANDGRPGNDPKNKTKVWRMDAEIAAELIADLAAQKTPRLLDYEHQTLYAAQNGQPAPASGWMGSYTYVPGHGLFAFADWTPKAKAHIAAKEYRFISPTFAYCRKTGRVLRLFHAALTNFPALDGMAPVSAAAQTLPEGATAVLAGNIFSKTQTNEEHPTEEESMDELKKMLGLPATATEAEVRAALASLQGKVKDAESAAASATAQGQATMDALAALNAKVTELTQQNHAQKLDATITTALKSGKLTAALEPWARELGSKDMAALTAFLEKAEPIAALAGMQSGGKPPADDGKGTAALTAEEKYAADELGISYEDYAKAKEAK